MIANVGNRKAQNQGPDEAEDHLAVSVDNVLGTHVDHLDVPAAHKVESLVDIFEFLDAQLWFGGIFAEGLLGQDLEQVDEEDAVRQVDTKVGDDETAGGKLAVQPAERDKGSLERGPGYKGRRRVGVSASVPFGEGFLLHNDPLLLKGSHGACASLAAVLWKS